MTPTSKQLRDPNYRSYEKSLAIGEVPIHCNCGDCGGPALIMPSITMAMPQTGATICPTCWHPLIGRILLSLARAPGAKAFVWQKKYQRAVRLLAGFGLVRGLEDDEYQVTPAGLALLCLKDRVGWEFENAHRLGWYRSERLPGIGWASGYWSHEGKMGQWIHHRRGRGLSIQVSIGAMHFGGRAA